MQVKLTCGLVGNGFAHSPGDVIKVGEGEGRRMIESQMAEPVEPVRTIERETAATGPAENASAPKPHIKRNNRTV